MCIDPLLSFYYHSEALLDLKGIRPFEVASGSSASPEPTAGGSSLRKKTTRVKEEPGGRGSNKRRREISSTVVADDMHDLRVSIMLWITQKSRR